MPLNPEIPPGRACSYAELRVAEQLGSVLAESGLAVAWRAVWLRGGMDLLAAAVAIAATGLGLLSLTAPVGAGIALAALLAIWTLEAAGLPSPLRELCPQMATQDAIAAEPSGSDASDACLLLVRADLHPIRPKTLTSLPERINVITWGLVAASLAVVAARALDLDRQAVDTLQLLPAMLSLGLLAAVVVGRTGTLEPAREGWTGIEQALSALALLDKRDSGARAFHVVVTGASGMNGPARVLKADRTAREACRCWEYDSGESVVAALGEGN